MKFLHLIDSVDARGGGPIEGALRLHEALVAIGHSGEFVSVDSADRPYLGTFPAKVHALGPGKGGYAFSSKLVPWLAAHASSFDAVIVNGLWQYPGLAAWRALSRSRTPYFVFTHGMLDPWFKHHYPLKHLKKSLYWRWGEYRVLRDAKAVLFTCEEEKLLARQSFRPYQVREVVLSFGTARPPQDAERLSEAFFRAFPALRRKRLLLYLGRIHEKKGCDLLIEAFAKRCRDLSDVHLVMAGPDQAGWVPALQQSAQHLGVADRISWPGLLSGDLKWGAFYASDAFCLPSHQENFGIAVAESLGCGRPVLISNKVNIWREIEADKAGFVEDDTLQGTMDLLDQWLASSPEALDRLRDAARGCFESRFKMDRVAERLARLVEFGSIDSEIPDIRSTATHA